MKETKQRLDYKFIRNAKYEKLTQIALKKKKCKEKIKVWYRDLDLLWMEKALHCVYR